MFVVLGRRILARHELSVSARVHERDKAALLLSLKQTTHVSTNEYRLNRRTLHVTVGGGCFAILMRINSSNTYGGVVPAGSTQWVGSSPTPGTPGPPPYGNKAMLTRQGNHVIMVQP